MHSMHHHSESSPEEQLKQLLLAPELDLLAKLEERLHGLDQRVGHDPALTQSVRAVLADALRQAGEDDPERMSGVLAPLVVSSLREEIRSSKDMMVEALYPLTGRLVSAAVRNAFRELLENIDSHLTRTLSLTRMRLRVQSMVTRKSYSELVLQRFPPFQFNDALVIHRETGLLIAHAAEEEEGIDRDLVGAMLSAIMAFTRDAFRGDEAAELSTVEFGESQLFICSSPAITLAVNATGPVPPSVPQRLESAFQGLLDRWGRALVDFDGELDPADRFDLVADLQRRLRSIIAAAETTRPKRSLWKGAIVFALVVLVLAGLAVRASLDYRHGKEVEAQARHVVEQNASLLGYPIHALYDRETDTLRVTGLVPGYDERDSLRATLEAALPDETLDILLNTLPKAVPPATEHLQKWAHANVIFFLRNAEPRDEADASRKLGELAQLVLDTPDDVRLRIVGYADPLGSRAINERLTMARAEYVAAALEELGVPRKRMVVVGRPGEQILTNVVGEGSESRRTEFEVVLSRPGSP
jgi:outer membrane protein OmpA-like peptidoglycan-associated protein